MMTLKNELVKIAPKGRINCVAPEWVGTPVSAESLPDPEVVCRALATWVEACMRLNNLPRSGRLLPHRKL